MELSIRTSDQLSTTERADARALCNAAWGAKGQTFRDSSWQLALGGTHALLHDAGQLIVHVSVVPRLLELDGSPLSTGYVEAMATLPARQRQGLGTIALGAINQIVDERYELGGLSTGTYQFYEASGWQRWPGPLGVRTPAGIDLTPKEQGDVMIRVPPGSGLTFDGRSLLTCELRPGEDW